MFTGMPLQTTSTMGTFLGRNSGPEPTETRGSFKGKANNETKIINNYTQ